MVIFLYIYFFSGHLQIWDTINMKLIKTVHLFTSAITNLQFIIKPTNLLQGIVLLFSIHSVGGEPLYPIVPLKKYPISSMLYWQMDDGLYYRFIVIQSFSDSSFLFLYSFRYISIFNPDDFPIHRYSSFVEEQGRHINSLFQQNLRRTDRTTSTAGSTTSTS